MKRFYVGVPTLSVMLMPPVAEFVQHAQQIRLIFTKIDGYAPCQLEQGML